MERLPFSGRFSFPRNDVMDLLTVLRAPACHLEGHPIATAKSRLHLFMGLSLMDCFPGDFERKNGRTLRHSRKRPIKGGKWPIEERNGVLRLKIMGCLRHPAIKRRIKRSMSYTPKTAQSQIMLGCSGRGSSMKQGFKQSVAAQVCQVEDNRGLGASR